LADARAGLTRRARGRPKEGEEARFGAREVLLRAGVAGRAEEGFASTGLDEILKRVSIPKGSFYYYFKSKEDFGLALIDRYNDVFARRLSNTYEDPERTPLERLYKFVHDAENGMRRYNFERGCLVGNLGQEMGNLPPSFRARLIDVFEDWQRKTAQCIRNAQLNGELPRELDADLAAQFFWIGWEGAVLRAKLERSATPLRLFADGFFRGLKA